MEEGSRKKVRSDEDKAKLIKKLNIIEGQVRGVKQMICDDRYCDDILIQISAIDKALKALGYSMLRTHIETCVVNDIKNDRLEIIDEVMKTIERL